MLAYEIYYVDIITFVYKMCLFFPHNVQVHSEFCPQNESSVLLSAHESMCSLQYFVDTMLIHWCFLWTKAIQCFKVDRGFTAMSSQVHELTEVLLRCRLRSMNWRRFYCDVVSGPWTDGGFTAMSSQVHELTEVLLRCRLRSMNWLRFYCNVVWGPWIDGGFTAMSSQVHELTEVLLRCCLRSMNWRRFYCDVVWGPWTDGGFTAMLSEVHELTEVLLRCCLRSMHWRSSSWDAVCDPPYARSQLTGLGSPVLNWLLTNCH